MTEKQSADILLKTKILVIDDDPNVFQLVEIALRDLTNFKLYYAHGGFEGLDKLNKMQPDAVILDIMMPDLDGFSILETMQGEVKVPEDVRKPALQAVERMIAISA